jgi:hypothetical protein
MSPQALGRVAVPLEGLRLERCHALPGIHGEPGGLVLLRIEGLRVWLLEIPRLHQAAHAVEVLARMLGIGLLLLNGFAGVLLDGLECFFQGRLLRGGRILDRVFAGQVSPNGIGIAGHRPFSNHGTLEPSNLHEPIGSA